MAPSDLRSILNPSDIRSPASNRSIRHPVNYESSDIRPLVHFESIRPRTINISTRHPIRPGVLLLILFFRPIFSHPILSVLFFPITVARLPQQGIHQINSIRYQNIS